MNLFLHFLDFALSGGPNRTEFTEYRSFGSVLFGSVWYFWEVPNRISKKSKKHIRSFETSKYRKYFWNYWKIFTCINSWILLKYSYTTKYNTDLIHFYEEKWTNRVKHLSSYITWYRLVFFGSVQLEYRSLGIQYFGILPASVVH